MPRYTIHWDENTNRWDMVEEEIGHIHVYTHTSIYTHTRQDAASECGTYVVIFISDTMKEVEGEILKKKTL